MLSHKKLVQSQVKTAFNFYSKRHFTASKNKNIKERRANRYLTLLGTKDELEKGIKEEAHLEKSIQSLRMRSSYTSGFGTTTQSFMTATKRTASAVDSLPVVKRKHKAIVKVMKPRVSFV
jgi:hypothetical protein